MGHAVFAAKGEIRPRFGRWLPCVLRGRWIRKLSVPSEIPICWLRHIFFDLEECSPFR